MFFFLSKTISFLAMPLTIVFALLLTAGLLRVRKWRRRLFWCAMGLFFLFTNEFVANELMKAWETDARAYAGMRKYKMGIVLTGTVIPQLKPDDRVYFGRGADRVTHTIQLYKLGLIEKILISGGSGRIIAINEPEAERFRDVMTMMGVPDSVIMIESQSRNTHESAREVKNILDTQGYTPSDCVLITSAFHMRRSLACFSKAELTMDTFSTDFYAHKGTYYPDAFLIPKLDALIVWHKLAKEWIGFAAYWVAGYI